MIFLFKDINIVYGDFVKRILIIFSVVLILGLCSCTNQKQFTAPDYPVIEEPDTIKQRTIDGYRKTEEKKQETSPADIYYANKNSKKFHIPTCTYAKKMNESSLLLEKDRDKLINKGYIPCSKCNP